MCAVGGERVGSGSRWAPLQSCVAWSWCGPAVPTPSSLGASVAGAKLEDPEVRSVASNQSELEFSSLQDMVRPVSCLSDRAAQQGPQSVFAEGYFCEMTSGICQCPQ